MEALMSHRPRPSIKTFTTVCFVFASTIYVSGDDLQKNIPESESLLIAQSKDLRLDKHDLDGAEKILQQVLAKFPNYYKAHYNLGLVYQDKGNYDAAIQELEKARTIRER